MTDLELHCPPSAGDTSRAVSILRSAAPLPPPGTLVRELTDESGEPVARFFEGRDGVHYWTKLVGWFWIAPAGTEVRYRFDGRPEARDLEQTVTGPVLGLALQQQACLLLHASAVLIGGTAVGFAAPHGAGKSTLAAAFLQSGHPLISDDILLIEQGVAGCTTRPGLPRVKLWGDSLQALGEDAARHDRVWTGWDKRRVEIGRGFGLVAEGRYPLGVVYLLEPRMEADTPVQCAGMDAASAAVRLAANMYLAELQSPERALRTLQGTARMQDSVRVRRVAYHRSFAALPAVLDAILADVRQGAERP